MADSSNTREGPYRTIVADGSIKRARRVLDLHDEGKCRDYYGEATCPHDAEEIAAEMVEAACMGADPSQSPDQIGYIVLTETHGAWKDDWDGEVHSTLTGGLDALAECRDAGCRCILSQLIRVEEVGRDVAVQIDGPF